MRSGWMRWVRTAAAGLALAAGVWAQGAGAAEPEVKNVTAAFLWPWTNAVGISFEVTGTLPTNAELFVTAKDVTSNTTYPVFGLTGDTGTNEGVHHMVWNLDQQGVKIQSTNVVFTVAYETNVYCVVDLSAGANASSYPVTYLYEPPSGGFNTDAYKTTKLVLRRIEAGTFTMGSPAGESGRDSDETHHQVILTKPYYIGLFEVTQKQWQLVTGSNPSYFSGDKRPVEEVSWNAIRGNSGTYNWPNSTAVDANSFIGRLQKRTGLAFDLPTEAQWEFACRAGTTTPYSYGNSANGDYMWYPSNSSSQTHEVGTKKPNAWGLYDMQGNVWEWCLDWYASNLGTAAVTDPKGASSGANRVKRGGGWNHDAAYCRSAGRNNYFPSGTGRDLGFRLVKSEGREEQAISFPSIGGHTWQDRVELSSSATSGLSVSFEVVSGPGVIEGNLLTFTGTGTVEVRAMQAGDVRWLPASVTQTVTVAKVAQSISFAVIGEQWTTNRVELSATATSGGEVAFEVVSGPGVIEGNVLTFAEAGTVVVRAVQVGDDKWLSAAAMQTVEVTGDGAETPDPPFSPGNGYVQVWGTSDNGMQAVPPAVLSNATTIAAGWHHCLALANGRVYAWGNNEGGQTNVDANAFAGVTAIAAGAKSSAAIKNGQIVLWGEANDEIAKVEFANYPKNGPYKAVALGANHGLVIRDDGSVDAWGNDSVGQVYQTAYWGGGIKAIAAGGEFSMGLNENGQVFVAGNPRNGDGVSLHISEIPEEIQGNVAAVAAGPYHAMALDKDGRVWVWGAWKEENVIPDISTTSTKRIPRAAYGNVTNVPASAKSGVKAIAAGFNICAALKQDGSLVIWGNELGSGSVQSIPFCASKDVKEIVLGYRHAMARTSYLPPSLTSSSLPEAYLEAEYTGQITAIGDPLPTFYVKGALKLPNGLSLNPATGAITGVPEKMGTNHVTIAATNLYGEDARDFTIVILPRKAVAPTWITESPLPDAVVGTWYEVQLEATGNPVYSVDASLEPLSAWATLTADGILKGWPEEVGVAYPTFIAANEVGSTNRQLKLSTVASKKKSTLLFCTGKEVALAEDEDGELARATLKAPLIGGAR